MWRCPTCGQTFVTRNMPHSCQVVALGDHFAGSALRPVFDAYLAAAELSGPVTVNATKSRVTFQARKRFAGIDKLTSSRRRSKTQSSPRSAEC